MMHHKMLGGLKDIIWTNINILTLCCDPDPECSNPIFSQDTLASDDVSPDQVWLPRNQQFRKYSRKSPILITWALTVTLTLKIAKLRKEKKSACNSGSWCCITTQNLVTKCSVSQKISSGQTFTDILNLCCDLDLKAVIPFSTGHSGLWCCTIKQVWLQTDQQFRSCRRNSHTLIT